MMTPAPEPEKNQSSNPSDDTQVNILDILTEGEQEGTFVAVCAIVEKSSPDWEAVIAIHPESQGMTFRGAYTDEQKEKLQEIGKGVLNAIVEQIKRNWEK